jgi:inosine/xanthosine triphosphate pyrophosphatase family protein
LDKADGDVRLPYDMIFIPQGYDTPAFFNLSLWKKGNARIQAVEQLATWLEQRST